MAITDEEFVSQLAEWAALNWKLVTEDPSTTAEHILAMAKEKGYEDGPRFVTYMKTPEGTALFQERLSFAREALKPPLPPPLPPSVPTEAEVLLTEEEKRRVISEFKQLMGREPTVAEMYELYAEEWKIKRGVL